MLHLAVPIPKKPRMSASIAAQKIVAVAIVSAGGPQPVSVDSVSPAPFHLSQSQYPASIYKDWYKAMQSFRLFRLFILFILIFGLCPCL